MKINTKVAIAAIVIVAVAAIWYFTSRKESAPISPSGSQVQLPVPAEEQEQSEVQEPVASAKYVCDGGKTIEAEFYKGALVPVNPGEPPVPTGRVTLVFGDDTKIELAQTLSADGGRYANSDESFIFWDKGDKALALENGMEKNYTNCTVSEPASAGAEGGAEK